MKKILLSIILLFAIQLSMAQDNKVELGIEGGPNSSFIYDSAPILNVVPITNYLLGVAGQYNVSDVFSIKGGINYDRKGFVQLFSSVVNPASPNPYVTTSNPTNLDYITIPIMAKVSLGKKVKFFMNAGPYFGCLIGARSKITLTDTSGNEHTTTINMLSSYKHFDFGAGGGFGIEIPIMNKLILSLEGRISYGFITNGYPFTSNPSTENESADLLLGLR